MNKRYYVNFAISSTYECEVEAENEDEAIEKATDELYFDLGAVAEYAEVIEVEELHDE